MADFKVSETITLTFGDCAENHVGMQKLGKVADKGFSKDVLVQSQKFFESKGIKCELIALHEYAPEKVEEAWLLVARNGVNVFAEAKSLMSEMKGLDWDKKAKSRGKVVNKHARHNLCFADTAQEPDYEKGHGRVVAFSTAAELAKVRTGLGNMLGDAGTNLLAEGNYYYDTKKCYIGWHGDAERRKVVAARLGAPMPIAFHWHYQCKPVGRLFKTTLNDGDLYIMSEKAVGTDWRRRVVYTLRHAAGDVGIAALKKVASENE